MRGGASTGGACVTTLFGWEFGKTTHNADPKVSYPVAQINTWMAIWEGLDRTGRSIATEHWQKTYAYLQKLKNKLDRSLYVFDAYLFHFS